MLNYDLNRSTSESLYAQIYRRVREDIETGDLASGAKMPSKRKLAEHLGVSVITVEGAYRQLEAEGYISSAPRRGFFVCELPERAEDANIRSSQLVGPSSGSHSDRHAQLNPALQAIPSSQQNSPNQSADPSKPSPKNLIADFTGRSMGMGMFPYQAWAKTMRRALSSYDERALLDASDAQGSLVLRQAIAQHVRGFRGMDVSPDCIVIGSGAQTLYSLIVQLLGRDRAFAIESPGYPRLARIYSSSGIDYKAIGLDEQGPIVSELESCGAEVLHCMPSHQLPTGITTSISRRYELLGWAGRGKEERQRYIVEDDFDCEFRMAGMPVPTLMSLDRDEHVIYANTFTKTLGLAFRIGYMVLPKHLMEQFRDRLGFYSCTVGALEQLTLASFIESGAFERHVNRRRTHYRKLLSDLVDALEASNVASSIRLHNVGAGLHFLMEVDRQGDVDAFEREAARLALDRGVALSPIGRYLTGGEATRSRAAFTMNFTSLERERVGKAVDVVSGVLEELMA